ncbi:MAG: hypothetical protein ACYTDT_14160, partial [Planctomycetota bacterium]
FNKPNAFKEVYNFYSIVYYRYCESFYVKGMTYEKGSEDRETEFKQCEAELDEFQFSLTTTTVEMVKSYMLYGEIAEARGNVAGAVTKYLDLVNFLSSMGNNTFVGDLALNYGYLRAVPLLVEELGYEPANLEKVIKLYAEAKSKYGSFRDLGFYFKRFELFQISAMVKLGDKDKLQGAIEQLFVLAKDKDPLFKRRALSVLADIASSDSLERGLRFKCVSLAYQGVASNPLSVNFRVANAFQSILVSLTDARSFETYGPACYAAICKIYENVHRWYDAALMYREASLRTRYFREKYANLKDGGDVPSHMKNRTSAITNGKEVYDFTKLMADEFSKCAGFCASDKYGDADNKTFTKLATDAKLFAAKVGDWEAKLNLIYDRAYEHQKAKRYAQAAVLYMGLPVEYKKYYLGLYNASNAYYSLADMNGIRAMNTRGKDDEVESVEYYETQKARLTTDLAQVQPSLLAGVVEDHWPDVMNKDVDGQYANWQKCLFFLKKYVLIDAQREWAAIKEKIAANPKADYVDAIIAVSSVRNERWAQKNPTGKGDPDIEMIRLGRAVYKLAFLMRRPPKHLKMDQKTALTTKYRTQALRLLKPFWSMFGTHLEKDDAYKNGSLRFAFEALAEGEDMDGAEEAYMAYAKAYPDKKTDIRNMVATLYSLLRKNGTPEANALIVTGSNLRSRARSLKKELFLSIGKSWPEWQKKLEEAKKKGELAVHNVLADHFWEVWIKDLVFGEAATETENSKLKKESIAKYLPDVLPELKKWWDTKSAEYRTRWADNVRKAYDVTVGKPANKAVKADLDKAIGSDNSTLIDNLRTAVGKLSDAKQTQSQTILSVIETNTAQDRYFVGTIFIYDLAEYLEAKAIEMEERARPLTVRTLKYFQLYRELKDSESKLSKDDLRSISKQYFRIRDWENTIKYWQQYVDGYGGVKRWGKETSITVNAAK